MPINLKIQISFDQCNNTVIKVYNRECLLSTRYQHNEKELVFVESFDIPGQLHLKVKNISGQPGKCKLEALELGGLAITAEKLDTLCFTTEDESGQGMWVREAYTDSTITVDFWAKDWIQYHLIIGNKIEL